MIVEVVLEYVLEFVVSHSRDINNIQFLYICV